MLPNILGVSCFQEVWGGMGRLFLIYFPQLLGPMLHSHLPPCFSLPGQWDVVVVVAYSSAWGCADFPGKRRYCGAGFARCFASIEEHIQDNFVSYYLTCRGKLSWPEKEQMSLSTSPL